MSPCTNHVKGVDSQSLLQMIYSLLLEHRKGSKMWVVTIAWNKSIMATSLSKECSETIYTSSHHYQFEAICISSQHDHAEVIISFMISGTASRMVVYKGPKSVHE